MQEIPPKSSSSKDSLQEEGNLKPYERWGVIAWVLSLAILVVSFVFVVNSKRSQLAGTVSPDAQHYNPAHDRKMHAPTDQTQGGPQSKPAPLTAAQQNLDPSQATRTLQIGTDTQNPDFTQHNLEVNANEVISLTLTNNSIPEVKHFYNLVIVKPGTEGNVARAGVEAGSANGYIPDTPDVIAATNLLGPGETQTIIFRAPPEPGDYPYISTFPGYSNIMHGTLKVK
jgi:azurin